MLDMGTVLTVMARQYVVWFICADGVEQAKFRVRRALTYHFVVADADIKNNCTPQIDDVYQKPDAVADADMHK